MSGWLLGSVFVCSVCVAWCESVFRLWRHSYGSFSRNVGLPAIMVVEGIRAEAQDGVLTVTLPRCLSRSQRQRRLRSSEGVLGWVFGMDEPA
jgi:hypothetical protein